MLCLFVLPSNHNPDNYWSLLTVQYFLLLFYLVFICLFLIRVKWNEEMFIKFKALSQVYSKCSGDFSFFPFLNFLNELWLLIIDIWRPLFFKILPWIARRSNQSILMEITPEYWLEGKMLKLKLQYFGHLRWRTDSLEKTLMLGKMKAEGERDNRGWDGWMASVILWL